ncbi:Cell number regulator 11 [Schistosoma japonicum]|uniref:Cell number regulator 11 n=1 Tax=Schistosoma japonicum TaxID=6182 RepID=A0A4Z2DIB2_SCHJA|nr:Cell number regulator 11 [Schistosoma japonicum]
MVIVFSIQLIDILNKIITIIMQLPTQPGQANLTVTVQPSTIQNQPNKKQWDVALCDCRSTKLAFLSCFCPWCVFGSITQEVGYPWCICCLSYLIAVFLSPVIWIHVFLGCCCRRRLRRHYGIKGHTIFDFFASLLCCPCILYQSAAQIAVERYRKLQPGVRNPYTSGFFRKVGHMIISCYSIPKYIRDIHCNSQPLLTSNHLTVNSAQTLNPQTGFSQTVNEPNTGQSEQIYTDIQSAHLKSQSNSQISDFQVIPGGITPMTQTTNVSVHQVPNSPQLQQAQNIHQYSFSQPDAGECKPVTHI